MTKREYKEQLEEHAKTKDFFVNTEEQIRIVRGFLRAAQPDDLEFIADIYNRGLDKYDFDALQEALNDLSVPEYIPDD